MVLISGGAIVLRSCREADAASELTELWTKIRTSNVWVHWLPFGLLHALCKPSAFNSAPLAELVRERLARGSIKKTLRVGAVSLQISPG